MKSSCPKEDSPCWSEGGIAEALQLRRQPEHRLVQDDEAGIEARPAGELRATGPRSGRRAAGAAAAPTRSATCAVASAAASTAAVSSAQWKLPLWTSRPKAGDASSAMKAGLSPIAVPLRDDRRLQRAGWHRGRAPCTCGTTRKETGGCRVVARDLGAVREARAERRAISAMPGSPRSVADIVGVRFDRGAKSFDRRRRRQRRERQRCRCSACSELEARRAGASATPLISDRPFLALRLVGRDADGRWNHSAAGMRSPSSPRTKPSPTKVCARWQSGMISPAMPRPSRRHEAARSRRSAGRP